MPFVVRLVIRWWECANLVTVRQEKAPEAATGTPTGLRLRAWTRRIWEPSWSSSKKRAMCSCNWCWCECSSCIEHKNVCYHNVCGSNILILPTLQRYTYWSHGLDESFVRSQLVDLNTVNLVRMPIRQEKHGETIDPSLHRSMSPWIHPRVLHQWRIMNTQLQFYSTSFDIIRNQNKSTLFMYQTFSTMFQATLSQFSVTIVTCLLAHPSEQNLPWIRHIEL